MSECAAIDSTAAAESPSHPRRTGKSTEAAADQREERLDAGERPMIGRCTISLSFRQVGEPMPSDIM
ncbi:MAG: hypothetical protein U5R48_18860 [Gammaproteobacteria bacterium]|nr:hypothetical protein [Gammaproteobacteria bacterium]